MDPDRYRDLFVQEAREHLLELNRGLHAAESIDDRTGIDRLFRAAHSFKGMAATLGHHGIAHLAHLIEDHLERARTDGRIPPDLLQHLTRAVDRLSDAVDAIERNEPPKGLDADARALSGAAERSHAASPDGSRVAPSVSTEPADGARSIDEADLADQAAGIPQETCRIIRCRIDKDAFAPRARLLVLERSLRSVGDIVASFPDKARWSDVRPGDDIAILLSAEMDGTEIQERLGKIPDLEGLRVVSRDDPPKGPDRPTQADPTPSGGSAGRMPPATEPPPDRPADEETTDDTEPAQEAADAPPTPGDPALERAGFRAPRTVRVDLDQVDRLLDQSAGLRIALQQLERRIDDRFAGPRPYALTEAMERLAREAKAIHDTTLDLRTLPVHLVTDRLPRLVRDLSDRLGKEIHLTLEGTDTQADRSILDTLFDPLVHLVKNAIDHGIEAPTERRAAGKPAHGNLVISFRSTATGIQVRVCDDGRGIPRQAALQKAQAMGLIDSDDGISDERLFSLLSNPGFSTADRVTEISGRGVGLDAVKATLEHVGGSLRIASVRGEGTTLTLQLPPTLAVMEALELDVDGEPYHIPVDAIVTILQVRAEDRDRGTIEMVDPRNLDAPDAEGANLTTGMDGGDETASSGAEKETVPLLDLAAVLALPPRRRTTTTEGREEKVQRLKERLRKAAGASPGRMGKAATATVRGPGIGVVVERDDMRFCLHADGTGAIREIVVKGFDIAAARARHVSGATIRGDGRVGLILDIPSLLAAPEPAALAPSR